MIKEDTSLYENPDDKDQVDKLEKGSVVRAIDTSDDDFILINYYGNMGYVRRDLLEDF
ncbi:hypothetical protein [uncultured Anaerococcus sp.]|uniref:hypothetical protein n=1 Tax=uncultured Anaerococcus sp. TaxID=293428 RepID=UPI00280BFF59|nr:hypothetical protein [uncultured Anaerococcus sp.]MDU5149640.1 hypothetical protein [Anaerococcus prevotii]